MTKHNQFFEGKVQSLGFERFGRRATVGVAEAGEYHFDTAGPERMSVISGEFTVRVGSGEWKTYAAGTSREVPAKPGFAMRAAQPSAYLCEFI